MSQEGHDLIYCDPGVRSAREGFTGAGLTAKSRHTCAATLLPLRLFNFQRSTLIFL